MVRHLTAVRPEDDDGGLGQSPWIAGALMRIQLARDLNKLAGPFRWFPHLCPTCLLNSAIVHSFDYVIQPLLPEPLEVSCGHCGNSVTLHLPETSVERCSIF